MHRDNRKESGFTLIELLVVISIIGLLASIILASLSQARIKARDSTRVQNIVALRTALELYYSTYGHYPQTFIPPAPLSAWSECGGHPTDYIPGLAPEFISRLPTDPSINCGGPTYSWYYASDGADYKLVTHPEGTFYLTLTDPAWDGGPDPCLIDGTTLGHYAAWTSGAACWSF